MVNDRWSSIDEAMVKQEPFSGLSAKWGQVRIRSLMSCQSSTDRVFVKCSHTVVHWQVVRAMPIFK